MCPIFDPAPDEAVPIVGAVRLRSRARTVLLFLLAIVIFALGGVITIGSTMSLLRARDSADHSQEVLGEVARLSGAINDVAASSRGFGLTGRQPLIADFHAAAGNILVHLQRLTVLTSDNSRIQALLAQLRGLVTTQVAGADALISARNAGGVQAAAAVSNANVETVTLQKIRTVLKAAVGDEAELLASRRESVRRHTYEAIGVEVMLGMLSALIVGLAARRMLRERQMLTQAQHTAMAAQRELAGSVAALQGRTADLTILSELSSVLGICHNLAEFHTAVAAIMVKAVPGSAGALGLINYSRSLVELPVSWGMGQSLMEVYHPEECCALRTGRPFCGDPVTTPIHCAHSRFLTERRSLCVPLSAQGETIGVLHLWFPAGMDAMAAAQCQQLVASIGEHLALALANLIARDALQHQATRDPLTGAYNRRYMLEALDRELLRARRPNRPVGLLMVDVDHFKQFNDEFGHQAGDEVLKLVVEHLRSSVRAEDYVCRYGGEEFAVILPEASAAVAMDRAEQMRRIVQTACRGREGGAVTISIGVAVYPDHGIEGLDLIRRADEALYAAKRAGRNRVELVSPALTVIRPAAA
ncbi:MAG: diguanylate cyclase [Gemmatimonadota bacterium]